jgi:hypothetical protein
MGFEESRVNVFKFMIPAPATLATSLRRNHFIGKPFINKFRIIEGLPYT